MIANMPIPTPLSERVRADDQIMAYVNAMTDTQFQNKALQNIGPMTLEDRENSSLPPVGNQR